MGLMRVKVAARRERCLNVRTRQAHSPFHRTLVQFNFSFQPSEDEVGSRAGHVQFRDDVANVILLSSPSGGKPQLAVVLRWDPASISCERTSYWRAFGKRKRNTARSAACGFTWRRRVGVWLYERRITAVASIAKYMR